MADDWLERLKPILERLPEVKVPDRHVPFNEKLFKYTGIPLVLYFVLCEIPLYGLSPQAVDYFANLRAVLAGNFGSILTLGIGPIVTASILLQLLVGGDIIKLDLANPEDRRLFQGLQKLLAIVLCFFEGAMMVFSGAAPPAEPSILLEILLILQLALGGILVIFLDEVVSKWGIGSGVGLFIAAGVSSQIIIGAFNPLPSPQQPGRPAGAVWAFLYSAMQGTPDWTLLAPVIGAIITFLVVLYVEGIRVEIPIAFAGIRGARGRFPVRLLYTSNIPVILASALFMNVRLWALAFQRMGVPILGKLDPRGQPISGLVYYLSPPNSIVKTLSDPLQALGYLVAMVVASVFFAILWVELTGMGPREIARHLHRAGLHIPGFRRDIRVLEKRLRRYIYPVTVMGGAFVGLLAAGADLMGALGGGTGVLLTVSILYNMYEEIKQERLMEAHPVVRRFLEKTLR
ncbi:preprotein translocase subunit SecY [Methanopyrus sp.]